MRRPGLDLVAVLEASPEWTGVCSLNADGDLVLQRRPWDLNAPAAPMDEVDTVRACVWFGQIARIVVSPSAAARAMKLVAAKNSKDGQS